MSWQYAYTAACESDGRKPRDEIKDVVEMQSLILNGNCSERFSDRVADDEVATLCKALSSVPSVTEVDLRYSLLKDDGATYFADMLRKNNSIQFVTLAHNEIGPEGARALADALMINMSVVSLSLRGNPIDDAGGIAFGTMLRGNNTLVSLDLGACGLQTKSLVSIVQALQAHPALCSVRLDKPLLQGPNDIQYVIQHLSRTIASNAVIVDLSMDHFGLYDDHLGALLPALVQNTSLTSLSFVGNKFSFDGGKLLGKLLQRRPDLVHLGASANRLDNEGAVAIATALKTHPSLQELYLANNGIGEKGLIALAEGVNASASLQQLLLWGNPFSEAAVASFYGIKDRLEQLELLDFDMYVVDGVPMLSQRN